MASINASADGTNWSRITTAPGNDLIQVAVVAPGGTIVMLGSRNAPDDRGSFVMVSRDVEPHGPSAPRVECVDGAVIGTLRIGPLGDCGPSLAWTSKG